MTMIMFYYQLKSLKTGEMKNYTSSYFLGEAGEKVCFNQTGSWEIIDWDCQEVDLA